MTRAGARKLYPVVRQTLIELPLSMQSVRQSVPIISFFIQSSSASVFQHRSTSRAHTKGKVVRNLRTVFSRRKRLYLFYNSGLEKGVRIVTIAEALSARLTELMEERNITAYRLSMLTGVNQTTIGDIRHKRNTAVNVRILFELCQGLGIEMADFFDSPLFLTENIID